MARKKKEENLGGIGEWIVTYGDMVTLLLCFFVAMFNMSDIEVVQLNQMISSFNNIGTGASTGGQTLSAGRMAELGNSINSLPSMEKGKMLATAKKKAVSLLQPEIKSNIIRVTIDERGLVITLAADAFFRKGSADINIEDTRDMLLRIAELLRSPELINRKIRIEGHTDRTPTDPNGPWPTNWELSVARALNVLHYLVDFGVPETKFQVAGFGDTMPLDSRDVEEAYAYNRRVDIIVLDEGHL